MSAPQQATLAEIADAGDPINSLATRGRWNRVMAVQVTDADNAIFVSKTHLAPWVRQKANTQPAGAAETNDWRVFPV